MTTSFLDKIFVNNFCIFVIFLLHKSQSLMQFFPFSIMSFPLFSLVFACFPLFFVD